MNTLDLTSSILAQAQFNFSFDSFKAILGGVLGFILIICFVAALGQIGFHYFVSRNQGGADMSIIWSKVIGMIVIILFSIIWAVIFGNEFLVDATSDGFDSLQGGSGTP